MIRQTLLPVDGKERWQNSLHQVQFYVENMVRDSVPVPIIVFLMGGGEEKLCLDCR